MVNTDLRSKLFGVILESAVKDNFQQELAQIPDQKELTAYQPSPELNQKISQIIAKSNRKLRLLKIKKTAKRAAVIVAVMIPVATAGLFSVEASRNIIFNAFLDWKSNHVEMHYEEEGSDRPSQKSAKADISLPAYLPDGFTQSNFDQAGATTVIEYRNKDNVKIRFMECPISRAGTSAIDTEHTVYQEIIINGYKASLFAAKTPKDSTILVWRNKTTSFTLLSPIDKEELIKMATSVPD